MVATMAQPLVSVIIPVGPRHAEHCRVAVASVKAQSIGREQIEVILAADGDTVIAPMAGVTIIPSTGSVTGPAATRNRALALAHGTFTTFLDADDYLLPRGMEHLLRAYASGRHGYVYGNAYTFERDGRYMLRGAPDYNQVDVAKYNLHVITTLIPTTKIRSVGGLDERVDAWEDWALHLRYAIAGICGYRTDQPIFVYRVYEGDRMQRFYGGDPELMVKVRQHYINEQGVIEMAGCCGGDATAAQIAALGIQGVAAPEPVPMGEGLVRVRYTGDSIGAIPFDFGSKVIRLGANPTHRYADVTPAEAAWLAERIEISIVPKTDPPMSPPAPQPILAATDVLTPDAVLNQQVLRPRAKANAQKQATDRVSIYASPECVVCGDRAFSTAGQYPVCNVHHNAYVEEGRKYLPDDQRVVWQQIQRAGDKS